MSKRPTDYSIYKNLVFENAVGEPTPDEIAEIEHEVGSKLPASYIEFLNVANGAVSDYDVTLPPPLNQEEGLCQVYSTKCPLDPSKGYDNILFETRNDRKYLKIPKYLLSFGGHDDAVRFFLDLGTENYGRVILFVEGVPAWTGLSEVSQFVKIADDFDEFLSVLHLSRHVVPQLLANLEKANSAGNNNMASAITKHLDLITPGWR